MQVKIETSFGSVDFLVENCHVSVEPTGTIRAPGTEISG